LSLPVCTDSIIGNEAERPSEETNFLRQPADCPCPNGFSFVAESAPDFCGAFRALREETIMALSAKGKTRTAPSKNNRPVTLKHLAATKRLAHFNGKLEAVPDKCGSKFDRV
jgi:hypothetical protein